MENSYENEKQLTNINVVKDIIGRHGFRFSKSLGQNFIINPHICPKMAELCGADKQTLAIEIGAGIGVLTRELAKRANMFWQSNLTGNFCLYLMKRLANMIMLK